MIEFNDKEKQEFRENISEAVDRAMSAEVKAGEAIDIHQCIKNSFEAAGFTCTDCYDGDIHNGMVLSMKNTKVALIWTDGAIEKQHVTDAHRLKKRLKYKQCAVMTFSNEPGQQINVIRAGGKIARKLKQKDEKLGLVSQMYFLV